jgi:hypothetical protein
MKSAVNVGYFKDCFLKKIDRRVFESQRQCGIYRLRQVLCLFMLSPQGRPIFLAPPGIEGLICLSLEVLNGGTAL